MEIFYHALSLHRLKCSFSIIRKKQNEKEKGRIHGTKGNGCRR
jgi:hypothetical protein